MVRITPGDEISWRKIELHLSDVCFGSMCLMKFKNVSVTCTDVMCGVAHFRMMNFRDGEFKKHWSDVLRLNLDNQFWIV